MLRNLTSLTLASACILGCSSSARTVVSGWTGPTEARDSLVSGITSALGYPPDTLQWCGARKLRVAFVNRPGEFPVRNIRNSAGNWVLHLPHPAVDHNLIRALAYAIREPVQRIGTDTVVITLYRTPTPLNGEGPLKASFEISVAQLTDGVASTRSNSALVFGVPLVDKPCSGGSPSLGGT
jgi:hypothetical protein